MTLKRNSDYWGRELPVNRGFWNFDEVRFDYYREANSHLAASSPGLYDMSEIEQYVPTRWHISYRFPRCA